MVCKAKQKDFIDNILDLEFEEDIEEARTAAIQEARDRARRRSGTSDDQDSRDKEDNKDNKKFSFIPSKDKFGKISKKPLIPNKGNRNNTDNSLLDIDKNLPNEEEYIETSLEDGEFRALGKSSTFIEEHNFAGTLQQLKKGFDIEKSLTYDPIRYYSGRSYVIDSSFKFKSDFWKNNKSSLLISDLTRYTINDDEENPSNFGRIVETYFARFNKNFLSDKNSKINPNLIKAFIDGEKYEGSLNNSNKDSFDFTGLFKKDLIIEENAFEMQKPFPDSEQLNKTITIGAPIVKTKMEYNFYIKDYEKIANKNEKDEFGRTYTLAKENYLPNLYVLSLVAESENPNSSNLKKYLNPFLKNYVYLDGFLNNSKNPTAGRNNLFKGSITPRDLFSTGKNNNLNFTGEYFDSFANSYKNFTSFSKQKEEMLRRSKNILIKSDFINQLKIYNEKKYMFPMSNTITIPTDKKTVIARILKDTNLMDEFMTNFIEKNINNVNKFKNYYNVTQYTDVKMNSTGEESKTDKKYAFTKTSLNTYDVTDIIAELKERKQSSKFITFSKLSERKNSKFINSLSSIIFQGKLQTFIRDKFRNYFDLYSGKKAYNETIFYRIEKRDANTNEVLQNYWIPNDPDVENIDIIDTQIKYNSSYQYSIFSYQFVIGTNYWYDYVSYITKDRIKMRIISEPNITVVEVPIISDTLVVKDDFPLPPQVTFVPFYNIDNTFGMALNNSSGFLKQKPISLTLNDDNLLKVTPTDIDGNLTYKNDDVPKRFEIFRLDKKPKSYDDFKQGLIINVSTEINPVKNLLAPAAMYNDNIIPNKKYYYIFRTVDVHNNFSNPSPVYEVEILNEKGMIYPIFKEVQFDSPRNINTLDAGRFIFINVKGIHKTINENKSNLSEAKTAQEANQNIVLGNSDISIPWGKEFKLITTSKQTGKKIEFRFKFDHKPIQSK